MLQYRGVYGGTLSMVRQNRNNSKIVNSLNRVLTANLAIALAAALAPYYSDSHRGSLSDDSRSSL